MAPSPMKFGYARVSTQDQNLNLQIDALQYAGCIEIAQEKLSGAGKQRPALTALLEKLRAGDTLVVWKLDRLSRSLRDLIDLVTLLQKKDVGFVSLNDAIDTTTPQGRLVFTLFAALAEFERDVIRERTKAGLTAARARGQKGGRPKGLSKEATAKAKAAKTLFDQQDKTADEIATILGISRATLYRYLERLK